MTKSYRTCCVSWLSTGLASLECCQWSITPHNSLFSPIPRRG